MATPDHQKIVRFKSAVQDLDLIRDGAGDTISLHVESLSGNALGDASGSGPTPLEGAVRRTVLSRRDYERLIILTDGRDSDDRDLSKLGADLNARDVQLSVKVYGSEVAPRDSAIQASAENSLLRLGDILKIRGELLGQAQSGTQAVVLKENGKAVKTITVDGSQGSQFQVRYEPPKQGRHVYSLELSGADEIALNNVSSFMADVVEDKIDVLLIEGYPRFEFKLMKGILEVDPIINLVSMAHIPGGGVYVQGKPLHKNPEQGLISSKSDLYKYDVIILRDVSRNFFRAGGDMTESRLQNIVQFVTKRGGGLFVGGGQDVYRAGAYEKSHLAPILPFDLSAHHSKKPQFTGKFFVNVARSAYRHPLLRLLPENAANRERLNSLQELDGSNNVGRFRSLATPLLTRTVELETRPGKTEKIDVPVMGYQAVGDGKVIAASVDTLWRWQLQPDFDDPPLTMLLANAIRYIAPPPSKVAGAPGIDLPSRSPQVGQDIELSTYLKDKNFDPITEAELVVTVTKPDKTTQLIYPRDLPEEAGLYRYRVHCDQPGRYTVATQFDLSANRDGMKNFVKAADGELITDINAWLSDVDQDPAGEPAVRDLEIWCSPLALILFIILVSLDCYIRKRQGLV
jgi:hypothetical protein